MPHNRCLILVCSQVLFVTLRNLSNSSVSFPNLPFLQSHAEGLAADASTAVQRRKEVKYCIFYKYAIRLLTTIKLLDHSEDIQQVAFYCRLLASVPLKQVHRIAAIAIAADKNLLAKNYGVAADLLRVIKAKSLYNAENVEEVLAECASERFLNSDGDISLLRPLCCFSVSSLAPEQTIGANFPSDVPGDKGQPLFGLQLLRCYFHA